jgi:hypothetical protein
MTKYRRKEESQRENKKFLTLFTLDEVALVSLGDHELSKTSQGSLRDILDFLLLLASEFANDAIANVLEYSGRPLW